ncbi:MAG: hypothetical protein Q8873_05530 [Bacillota bacterium]|nr:hypothetical protein [Bacillota bacterium]
MKRILIVLPLAVLFLLTFCACGGNGILGTWEAKTNDGARVVYELTDDYENVSTKATIYHLTVTNADGTKSTEKGTYDISDNAMITFRPENSQDNATVDFKMDKDTLTFKYTVNFKTKTVVFKRVTEKSK